MVCFPKKFDVFSWPTVVLVVIFAVVVGLVILSYKSMPQMVPLDSVLPLLQSGRAPAHSAPAAQTVVNVKGGDDRYTRAPEAERDWDTGPDLSRVPVGGFNIPTQGIPESYQSMGIIKTPDGKMLPLYGRRSISSRDRYNYYTRTDTYNPIPIPVTIKGRDCQDQVGCPELYDGDKVNLLPTKEPGEVTIYRVRDIIR
jgi:Family of unknown function (DUF5755)